MCAASEGISHAGQFRHVHTRHGRVSWKIDALISQSAGFEFVGRPSMAMPSLYSYVVCLGSVATEAVAVYQLEC